MDTKDAAVGTSFLVKVQEIYERQCSERRDLARLQYAVGEKVV